MGRVLSCHRFFAMQDAVLFSERIQEFGRVRQLQKSVLPRSAALTSKRMFCMPSSDKSHSTWCSYSAFAAGALPAPPR
jgi:hypothetical protein